MDMVMPTVYTCLSKERCPLRRNNKEPAYAFCRDSQKLHTCQGMPVNKLLTTLNKDIA